MLKQYLGPVRKFPGKNIQKLYIEAVFTNVCEAAVTRSKSDTEIGLYFVEPLGSDKLEDMHSQTFSHVIDRASRA